MFVEGQSPSTHIRSRFPLHPSSPRCSLWMEHPSRGKVKVPSGQWGALGVTAQGKQFTVYFNGEKLYEVEDETFKDAGKVGLWTKADSVTYFDDLRVIAR